MDELIFKQQVGTKIKQLRSIKGWSRQQMADKLEMSLTGYGEIERGKTDIPITRLQQIADTFEISLPDLLNWNENKVFNFTQSNNQDCNNWNNWQLSSSDKELNEIMLKNELEKYQLMNQSQAKEIEHLKQQLSQLQEIIALLKKHENE